jgi:hypothetical protein
VGEEEVEGHRADGAHDGTDGTDGTAAEQDFEPGTANTPFMHKRTLLAAALLLGPLGVGVGGGLAPVAATTIPSCGTTIDGMARLADDPAGDTTYANEGVPNSTDGQEDLRYVNGSIGAGVARFVIGVADLTETDPPASTGLLYSLDLQADGSAFSVEVSRSYTTGDTGTASINGSSEGVTVAFDPAADTVTVTGPSALLPKASSVQLTNAESRADGGFVLAPLTDTAAGSCAYTYAAGLPPVAPFDRTKATITVIDTGSEASNPEFDYDETVPGPNGQFVGWWDFSGTTSHPACGDATTIWCTAHGPYDPDLSSGSHGTGTTGMAAGTNASAVKTASACPGCNLAVAKVLNEDSDSLDGDIASAIRWAVDVVHTDVISVSIGAVAPIPEPVLHDTYVAQRYAREHGVFVTFANGNGWGNAGIPGQPGGFMNYGNSIDVLSVGANGLDGYLVTTDPEVTGPFTVMTSASKAADDDGTADGYHQISGTSFSTPFTAGLAGHLIASGRLCGAPDLSPEYLEQLIKDTAVDDITVPPSNEGYGEVSIATMQTALGVLCNGDARPAVDPITKTYVDKVSGTERMFSSDTVSGWTLGATLVRNPGGRKYTPGSLGISVPTLADTDIYEVTVLPGKTLDDTFSYLARQSNKPDLDVYLFDVTNGVSYSGRTLLASAASGGGINEHLVYRNTTLRAKKVRVVVAGFSIFTTNLPYGITGTPLGTTVDEGMAVLTPAL